MIDSLLIVIQFTIALVAFLGVFFGIICSLNVIYESLKDWIGKHKHNDQNENEGLPHEKLRSNLYNLHLIEYDYSLNTMLHFQNEARTEKELIEKLNLFVTRIVNCMIEINTNKDDFQQDKPYEFKLTMLNSDIFEKDLFWGELNLTFKPEDWKHVNWQSSSKETLAKLIKIYFKDQELFQHIDPLLIDKKSYF